MSENTNVRILPMPVPRPIWRYDDGGYPDRLQVPFRNGHVRTYWLAVEQPEPQVISRRGLALMFKENPLGYKPKHAKK